MHGSKKCSSRAGNYAAGPAPSLEQFANASDG